MQKLLPKGRKTFRRVASKERVTNCRRRQQEKKTAETIEEVGEMERDEGKSAEYGANSMNSSATKSPARMEKHMLFPAPVPFAKAGSVKYCRRTWQRSCGEGIPSVSNPNRRNVTESRQSQTPLIRSVYAFVGID